MGIGFLFEHFAKLPVLHGKLFVRFHQLFNVQLQLAQFFMESPQPCFKLIQMQEKIFIVQELTPQSFVAWRPTPAYAGII